jgi:hypothetical protein
MFHRAGALATVLALCITPGAFAQIILPPPAPPYLYPVPGYRITYRNGNVLVTGFIGGVSSYNSYSQQTVIYPPTRIVINNYYGGNSAPILGGGYEEVRGYDLDLVPGKKTDIAEAKPKPAEDDKPLPGQDVSKSKPVVRPGDPGMAPKQAAKPKEPEVRPSPELPRPPDALADPRDETARLIEQGITAFQGGLYGLAAQRFRQATEVSPNLAKGYFFLAQAEFAQGRFRDAVDTIHTGMKIDKQWPRTPVQPRLELYKGRDAEYGDHLKRLTDAAASNLNNSTLLFLVGHQLWFDGQRKDALALFQSARPLASPQDRVYIDAFLAVGGPGQMAKL